MKLELRCKTLCTHCKSVRYTNSPYKEAIVYACPDCTDNSNKTPEKGTYILPNESGKGYSCLCGEVMDTYYCRCPGCKEINYIDTKGKLIKH